ncbi:Dabb family protein [Glaciihabitans sp. INWT7]|uniref:Dabb family protein n=1 Tax=Glaciihabitans sp. INWT7 TaxID=2596912 RepID=UPI001628E460|nr:Dabb family protein [Glaciihabitans sp. INWT7]QNE45697.1 Dabb family protein [Glaciihabitans sp. INWT7]
MLKHVVSWKVADAASPEGQEKIASIVAGLESLVGVVPSIRALSVGPTVVTSPDHWDLALIVDFDDEVGLEAYQVHPEHQKVGAFIRSQITAQASVDFLV